MIKILALMTCVLLTSCASWTAGDTARLIYQSCRAAPAITAVVCAAIPAGPHKQRCLKAQLIMTDLEQVDVCR